MLTPATFTATSGTSTSAGPPVTTPISRSDGTTIPFEQPPPLLQAEGGMVLLPGAHLQLPPIGTPAKREGFPKDYGGILQRLKEIGAVHEHTTASHQIFKLNGQTVVVPANSNMPIGTARSIRKQVEAALAADTKVAVMAPDISSLTADELVNGREDADESAGRWPASHSPSAREPTFGQLLRGEVLPHDATVRGVPVKWATPTVFNGQRLLKVCPESRKDMEALKPWRVDKDGGSRAMFIRFNDAQLRVDDRPVRAIPVPQALPEPGHGRDGIDTKAHKPVPKADPVPAALQATLPAASPAKPLLPSSVSSSSSSTASSWSSSSSHPSSTSSSSSSRTSSILTAPALPAVHVPPAIPPLGPMQAVVVGKHWAQLMSSPGGRPTVLRTMAPVVEWECRGIPWETGKDRYYRYTFDIECPTSAARTTRFEVQKSLIRRVFDGASVVINQQRVASFDADNSHRLTHDRSVHKIELVGHKFSNGEFGLVDPKPALQPLGHNGLVRAGGKYAVLSSAPGMPQTVFSSSEPFGLAGRAMTLQTNHNLYTSVLPMRSPDTAVQDETVFNGEHIPDLPFKAEVTVYGRPATWVKIDGGLNDMLLSHFSSAPKDLKLGPALKAADVQLMGVIGMDPDFTSLVRRGLAVRLQGEGDPMQGHSWYVLAWEPGILRARVWDLDATPLEPGDAIKTRKASASDLPASHSTMAQRMGSWPGARAIYYIKPDSRDYVLLNGSRMLVLPDPLGEAGHFVGMKCEFRDMPLTDQPLVLENTGDAGHFRLRAGPPEALTHELEYRINRMDVRQLLKVEGHDGCFLGEPPQFRKSA